MRKYLLFLISIISTNIIFSQKYLDATIINSENDTIHSKIKVSGMLFNADNIDIRSFYNSVILVDNNLNVTQKIKSKNLKELIFDDASGNKLTFVNKNGFLDQLLFDGKKIKWFRSFTQNLYDGSLSSSDYMIKENGEVVKLGGLGSRRKKKLKEITQSKPELAEKIDKLETYNLLDMKELLLKYEE